MNFTTSFTRIILLLSCIMAMQNAFNTVKGAAFGVAEKFVPILKVNIVLM